MKSEPTSSTPLDVQTLKLSTLAADKVFSFTEIGSVTGHAPETLRSWLKFGLELDPERDKAEDQGGRSHLLHWRTVLTLLLALRLNQYGFNKRSGQCVGMAERLASMVELTDLETTGGPMLIAQQTASGVHVATVDRAWRLDAFESSLSRFYDSGTLILDPVTFGRVLWRVAMDQTFASLSAALAAARGEDDTDTFDAEQVEAATITTGGTDQ